MNELFATIDPPLAIAAIFINFIFVVLVLVRTSRSFSYMMFLFICSAVIYWNFCALLVRVTAVHSWFYLSQVGSAAIPPLMFHFVVTLVRPGQKNAVWLVPAYLLSGLLGTIALMALFSSAANAFIDSPAWDISYLLVLFPLFISSLVMLLQAFKRTRADGERNRLWYILLAGVIGVITAVSDHIQVFKIPVPPLGHLGSVFYPSILAVGVFKHRTAYDILAQTRMKLEVMNEMAAAIAHEIRNPLTALKGALKLISGRIGVTGQRDTLEYLDIMNEEIDRLDSILINFQYLTRPLKLEKELVNVNDIIGRTVKLVEVGALDTIAIVTQLSPVMPAVRADALSLKQVFLNIIKNAAEACRPKGEISIKTDYVSSWVKIHFADTGPGIPVEIRERIFDPFFTTKEDGLGMGLSISRRIIEAQGGRIEVDDVAGGASLTILLPEDKSGEKGNL